MYILYKVSESSLTANTKFTLLNVESRKSVTVGLGQFRKMIDSIFNVMIENNRLHMTDCNTADFFKKSSDPYADCNMVFAEFYSEKLSGNDKIAGYEFVTKDGEVKCITADNVNIVKALNEGTFSLQNANYTVKNNRLILSSKGEYPFLMHESGYGMKVNADRLLEKIIEQARAIGIPCSDNIDPHIRSIKCKTVLGRCTTTQHLINGVLVRSYTIKLIDISFKFKPQYIMDTLVHEFIHTCPECNNHGYMFKYYAEKMNRAYGYNITTKASEEKSCDKAIIDAIIASAKYKLRCKNCGQIINRNRMCGIVKNPEIYICGICHKGRFERIR